MKSKQNTLITEDCRCSYLEFSSKLEQLKGKTLLITGGTGFLGSWICEMVHYMNMAHKMGISLIIIARNKERFKNNLPHMQNSEDVQFICSDIRENIDLSKDTNYIIHAASNPDNRFHASRPFESMTTVADGTSAILQSAVRLSSLDNIINVSSSAVYSTNLKKGEKFSEDSLGSSYYNKLSNSFLEANRYGESLCNAARSEFRLPIVTIRPFTFCGAYQNIDSPWAINNFINDAIHKRPIRIHGNGEVVRSYMYGSDLAVWTLIIMLNSRSGQTYNVGSSNGHTLREIADKVASHFQPTSSVIKNTSIIANNTNSVLLPDVEKAEKEFGLKQVIDIDRSIKRSVDWYKDILNYA
jgi:nucleoside-diphosphate-sugar epimerase